jgi:hypothetical protein
LLKQIDPNQIPSKKLINKSSKVVQQKAFRRPPAEESNKHQKSMMIEEFKDTSLAH